MFDFNITIRNPIAGLKIGSDENFFCYNKNLTKNKNLEIEGLSWQDDIFAFIFSISSKQDHAGLRLELCLLTLRLGISVYDSRHWNYTKDRWYSQDEINNLEISV